MLFTEVLELFYRCFASYQSALYMLTAVPKLLFFLIIYCTLSCTHIQLFGLVFVLDWFHFCLIVHIL